MKKQIKNLILILCVALVVISLLSFFLAATQAFHICKSASCPICRFMDMVADFEKSLAIKSDFLLILIAFILCTKAFLAFKVTFIKATPVKLMVRMND